MALRFMDRLVALSPGQRALIRAPRDPDRYAEALQAVQKQMDGALEEDRGAPPRFQRPSEVRTPRSRAATLLASGRSCVASGARCPSSADSGR